MEYLSNYTDMVKRETEKERDECGEGGDVWREMDRRMRQRDLPAY